MTQVTDWLMTPAEVAAYYSVDPKTVTRWAKSGRLPVARMTPGGHRRFWESDVIAAGQRQSGGRS
jgi:excisionase family DNA binding protein